MYSFCICICKWDSELYVYDTINTTTVVVLFFIFIYDILILFKTWVHQRLKNQVKSPSKVKHPLHLPKVDELGRDQSGLEMNCSGLKSEGRQ